MQIQPISNSSKNNQSFQGKINIENDLSYLPCKYVRQAYDSMTKMIENKPFDLFISQNHKNKSLSFVVQKEEHFGKINKPFVKNIIADASTMDNGKITKDLYSTVAEETIKTYEEMFLPSQKDSKIKRFFNKIGQKFMEIIQDE